MVDIYQRNTRLEIRAAIQRGGFPKHTKKIENILVRAIRIARLYRKKPPKWDRGSELLHPVPFHPQFKLRPHKSKHRDLVINALFRAWQLGFDEEPVINNREYKSTPFVKFAEDILLGEEIYNTIDNLDQYRSNKNHLFRNMPA